MDIKSQPIVRLGGVTNAMVVQLPERNFPGIVIQGDSLSNILDILEISKELVAKGEVTEAIENIEDCLELIDGYLSVYETVLNAAGIRLPYENRVPHVERKDE
jgi:hypothetical protein